MPGETEVWREGFGNVDNLSDPGYTYLKKEVNAMKKGDKIPLISRLASPVLLVLLGAILVFNPDSASAMIARVLGWILTLVGIGFGISAIVNRSGVVGKGITAVGCVCIGGFLVANPLLLAAGIGKLLGILIIIRGLRDVFQFRGKSQLLAILTVVVGVVLVALPLTTSRLVFCICGIVILGIGITMLIDRLKNSPRLEGGDDPNIIDAL